MRRRATHLSAIETAMPPRADRATVSHANMLKPTMRLRLATCGQSYIRMVQTEMVKAWPWELDVERTVTCTNKMVTAHHEACTSHDANGSV